jgi:hypothetical protein
MRKKKTPNPGSQAAQDQGCLCPILDNENGAGFPFGPKGETSFWINEACPLHVIEKEGEDVHAVYAPGNLSVVLCDSRRGRAAVGHNVMARKGRRQGFECGQEVWVQGQRTWLHLKASYKNGWHVSPQVRLGGHLTDVVFEREMEVRE